MKTLDEPIFGERIRTLMNEIRQNTPHKCFNTEVAANSDNTRIDYLNDKIVKRVVITLRSSGCSWTLRQGGCTMCGHYAATTQGKMISPHHFINQFKNEFKKYRFEDYPVLCIYNSGSILNEEELPKSARREILKIISRNRHIKKVVLETRTEYATEEVLSDLVDILRGKEIEIAVGLESYNDMVLRYCINKGLTLKNFEKRARVIQSIANLRVYLLIKPPFLTEKEAIDDTVASTKYLRNTIRPNSIHLEPCTIQRHSLVYHLWKKGFYRLPWLWSIVEILNQLNDSNSIYVSPFKHIPQPKLIPHNCGSCDSQVISTILNNFNLEHDIGVFEGLSCDCKEKWKMDLKYSQTPIQDRILEIIDEINIES